LLKRKVIRVSIFTEQGFLPKRAADDRFDPDQEKELALRFQQGDLNAYKQLRRAYQPLINHLVQKWKPGHGKVSAAQLRMSAEWAFPHGVMKYDPNHEKQSSLHTWMTGQLDGNIRNAVADLDIGPHVSRSNQSALKRYNDAVNEARMEFGQNPTEKQIIKYLPEEFNMEQLDLIKRLVHTSTIGDVATKNEDGSSLLFRDQFTGTTISDHPDEVYQDIRIEHIKDVMRRRLTPVDYAAVYARMIDGQSMADIGLRQNMSSTKLRAAIARWNQIKQEEGLF
jgi:DNA-directed RNA polymerase specialized sigma subunit